MRIHILVPRQKKIPSLKKKKERERAGGDVMRMQGLEKEARVRKGDMSPDFWALCLVQDKSLDSKPQREEDA